MKPYCPDSPLSACEHGIHSHAFVKFFAISVYFKPRLAFNINVSSYLLGSVPFRIIDRTQSFTEITSCASWDRYYGFAGFVNKLSAASIIYVWPIPQRNLAQSRIVQGSINTPCLLMYPHLPPVQKPHSHLAPILTAAKPHANGLTSGYVGLITSFP